MNSAHYANLATDAIGSFSTAAHSAIDAYRAGGERLGTLAGQRWNSAFRQASPQLTAETRKNATRAKKVLGGYYAKGIEASAGSAEVVVDTLAKVAATGVGRVADLGASIQARRA